MTNRLCLTSWQRRGNVWEGVSWSVPYRSVTFASAEDSNAAATSHCKFVGWRIVIEDNRLFAFVAQWRYIFVIIYRGGTG